MSNVELQYLLALTQVPLVGGARARLLLETFQNAEAVFKASKKKLLQVPGIAHQIANNILQFSDFSIVERELQFLQKSKVQVIPFSSPAYPQRLLQCEDAPVLVFYRGQANLNEDKMVAIVGTRHCTDYGKKLTEELVSSLAKMQVTIVSGLALGIDGHAHRAALQYQTPTIGVLGNGLSSIYPPQHAAIAKQMVLGNGGLLTTFFHYEKPDRQNFPSRNRIVAGMTDATILIESGTAGGSLITVDLANGYHKDVFAFPGRPCDSKSEGCNMAIKQNKAQLITQAEDIIEAMNWDRPRINTPIQPQLFPDLTDEEKCLVNLLGSGPMPIDTLVYQLQQSHSKTAALLLQLELKGVVKSLPGKQFALN